MIISFFIDSTYVLLDLHGSGGCIHIHVTYSKINDAMGNLTGIVLSIIKATENTGNAFKNAERYNDFQINPSAMLITDKDFIVRNVNHAFIRKFGLSRPAAEKKKFAEPVLPFSRREGSEIVKRFYRVNQTLYFMNGISHQILMLDDVTQRIASKKDFYVPDGFYQELFVNFPAIIWRTNKTNALNFVNRMFYSFSGLPHKSRSLT